MLSTLSAQKCDRPSPTSAAAAANGTAVRYAPVCATLHDYWHCLHAALLAEYPAVVAATLALEQRCAGRDGMPGDLVPTRELNELAGALDAFAASKSLGIVSGGSASARPIGAQMESEFDGCGCGGIGQISDRGVRVFLCR